MKIVTRQRAPEFPGFTPAEGARVLFEGELFEHCFAVDKDAGVGWRYASDGHGRILLNRDRTDALVEKRFGSFRVETLSQ